MILRRLPDSRFSIVEREWEGYTAVILGGGPSLTLEQINLVQRAREADAVRVIAVNDAYLWAPWADVNYFADARWWTAHSTGIDKPLLGLKAEEVIKRFADFAGQRCTMRPSDLVVTDDLVHVLLRNRSQNNKQGLSRDPRYLETGNGKNSSMQALNVVTLAGSTKIILLGVDGRPGEDGRQNFHGAHPWVTDFQFWEAMRRGFSDVEGSVLEAGVRVINCSPGSAIDSFPKMALEEALAMEAVS